MFDAISARVGQTALLRENAVRARPRVATASATSSSSLPVRVPPRRARSSGSEASEGAWRSGSPDSSR